MKSKKDIRVKNALGGQKDDGNKPRLHLFSFPWLMETGGVLTKGGDTYGDSNWRLVERSRYEDALLRHIFAYLSGEEFDPKDGFSHLSHAHCNLMFLWEKDQEAKKPIIPSIVRDFEVKKPTT